MILAAGLGTRMGPLADLRPKVALPVRGLPLLAYPLALLAHHGFQEVIINVHQRLEAIEAAAERYRPPGLSVRFSREPRPLGTGGGMRRAAAFLRESDPCLILAGDMILDADLGDLMDRHRRGEDSMTLLLRDDPRSVKFGTIGVDEEGRVRRIGRRFELGGEKAAGIYAHATVIASRAFETLPDREAFSHFNGWIWPLLQAGARDIRAVLAGPEDCLWEPVGTPQEYLHVNLSPPKIAYLDADGLARRGGARFGPDLVIGAGATLGEGAVLDRAVVWDGESVPPGFRGSEGVFAGGAFHSCAAVEPGQATDESGS